MQKLLWLSPMAASLLRCGRPWLPRSEGGVGAELFQDVVAAVEAAVRAPWDDGPSIAALHLLQAAAHRLAAAYPQVPPPPPAPLPPSPAAAPVPVFLCHVARGCYKNLHRCYH